jgi:2-keto-4-pentenoate hydratase/2-oxohepta-3-ene-1,7-dioic acid hydratase in catechol pathway
MPWATVRHEGRERLGLVVGDEIVLADDGRSMLDMVATGGAAIAESGNDLRRRGRDVIPLAAARLAAPVPRPPSIRDALCFLEHMRGCLRALGRSPDLPEVWDQVPAFYFGNPANVYGPYDDVAIAPGSTWFDYELEVGAVIGPGGRDLDPKTADDHIVGYTFYCDWSARDLQMKDLAQGLGQAKGKDSGTTLGPWLVTADELADHHAGGRLALEIAASVNGEQVAAGTTADMDWGFDEVVAYCSRGVDLLPGDVIGSGTIPGGCLLEHVNGDPATYDRWLKPGDVVCLYGSALGRTEQTIVAGAAVHRLRSGH